MENTNEASSKMASKKVTILGGGPSGLLLARLLTLANVPCEVLESDLSMDSRHQGGMLDIHEDTGQVALRRAGLYEAFRDAVMEGADALRVLDRNTAVHLDQLGNGQRPEIDRGSLRKLLSASLPDAVVRWNTRVTFIHRAECGFVLTMADGQQETAETIVGADGAWSRVRPLLTEAVPTYTGVVFIDLRFRDALNRHPVAARLVGDGLMFALSNNRGFIGHREPEGEVDIYALVRLAEAYFPVESTAEAFRPYFADWHPDYQTLLTRNDGFAIRPLYMLPVGLRWPSAPDATLLGDAAHLMSPFAGEGVNQSLADAADLAEQIVGHPNDFESAFAAYEERMYYRSAKIAAESARMLDVLISPDPLPVLLDFFSDMAVEPMEHIEPLTAINHRPREGKK